MKTKRKHSFFLKIKLKFVLWLFLIFFSIFLLCFLLLSYLYEVQRVERLDKVEDYQDFVLTYDIPNRCSDKIAFTQENTTYIYECIDEVYLHYGSTKATLKEVLESEYLTLGELVSNMKKETKDEFTTLYTRLSTDKRKGYQIEIKREEAFVTVYFRSYID